MAGTVTTSGTRHSCEKEREDGGVALLIPAMMSSMLPAMLSSMLAAMMLAMKAAIMRQVVDTLLEIIVAAVKIEGGQKRSSISAPVVIWSCRLLPTKKHPGRRTRMLEEVGRGRTWKRRWQET